MGINFSLLQDKIRNGQKTLTFRQLFIPQAEIGKTVPLYDSTDIRLVPTKNRKGFKAIKAILKQVIITNIYFRIKQQLTLEECCNEQGRPIPIFPNLPFPYNDLVYNHKNKSHTHLLELKQQLIKNHSELAQLYFPVLWQLESCLVIIEKSWRVLTKLNGKKPNGVIIRWD